MAETETKLEAPKENFLPDWPMLEKLFLTEEITDLRARKLDADGLNKYTEEKISKEPEFQKKTEELSTDKDTPEKFKDWLKERLKKVQEAKEKAPGMGVPIDVGADKKAEEGTDGVKPPEATKPDANADKPTEGTDQPKKDGTQPDGAKTPEKKPTDANAAKKTKERNANIIENQKRLHNMSFPDLMKELLTKGSELFGAIGSIASGALLGEKKFTPTQVKEIKVDVQKDADKKFTSPNRAVEYVCSVLNLPAKKDAKTLLEALKSNPDFVYETDKNKFKDVNVGDVLFFQKADKQGEPYLTAVVSKLEPLSMKMVSDAGVPREVEIAKSPQFQNEWMGFVKLPRGQKVNLPGAPANAPANPAAPPPLPGAPAIPEKPVDPTKPETPAKPAAPEEKPPAQK